MTTLTREEGGNDERHLQLEPEHKRPPVEAGGSHMISNSLCFSISESLKKLVPMER